MRAMCTGETPVITYLCLLIIRVKGRLSDPASVNRGYGAKEVTETQRGESYEGARGGLRPSGENWRRVSTISGIGYFINALWPVIRSMAELFNL